MMNMFFQSVVDDGIKGCAVLFCTARYRIEHNMVEDSTKRLCLSIMQQASSLSHKHSNLVSWRRLSTSNYFACLISAIPLDL